MSAFQSYAAACQVSAVFIAPHEKLELPTIALRAHTLQISLPAHTFWATAILRLPVEQLVADRVVIVKNRIVITASLVKRYEQQFRLAFLES